MVYDLTRASGRRWGRGEQGGSIGVSLTVGVDGGGRTLGVRDAVGANHGSPSAFAVVAVKLKVAFSSTVATVNVFSGRIWSFFRWTGAGRGRARICGPWGLRVATETVDFCFKHSDFAILGFFGFLESSDEFSFGFGGVGGVVVVHGHHGEASGTRCFGLRDCGSFFGV